MCISMWLGIIAGVAVIVVLIYYRKNVDHFTSLKTSVEKNKCRDLCKTDCKSSCMKNKSASLNDQIFDMCVSVCENGVVSCMKKCNGCSVCS